MSPVDHLPPEILSTIFLHVLPPFDPDALENPERVPVVLGQVCRLWRTVTLALPALWASFDIRCNLRVLHPPLHIIHTYLQRSATHPLSIVLNIKVNSPCFDSTILSNQQFPAVLDMLVTVCNRWRHMVMLVTEATEETFNLITEGDAPLLQSFNRDIEKYPLRRISSILFRALHEWTQLESLTWPSIDMYHQRPELGDYSWPRLTTLCLRTSLSTSECLTLLRLSPRLSTAMFYQIDRQGDDISPRYLIHTVLQNFHATGTYTATLIDALTLPSLVDLYLCFDTSFPPSAPQGILHPFLVRSTPPLRTLSITNLNTPEPVLLRALELVGGLHTLILTEFAGSPVLPTAAFIRALHPPPPPGPLPLCPCLRILHISAIGGIDAPDGMCAAMLRARWGTEARNNGVASLAAVRINLGGFGHDRDYAEICALGTEGMDVTVN